MRYRFDDGTAGATNFPDQAQADQFARMIDDYGLAGALARIHQPIGPKRMATGATVDEALERYIAQRPNPDTRDKYRRTARLHISPTLGAIRINRLTTEDVQLWLNGLTGTGHSIESIHMVLKVALAAAVARGEIKTNPARKASRVAQDGVRLPASAASMNRLPQPRRIRAVLKSIPRRYQTFVEFLADTGCRLGRGHGADASRRKPRHRQGALQQVLFAAQRGRRRQPPLHGRHHRRPRHRSAKSLSRKDFSNASTCPASLSL